MYSLLVYQQIARIRSLLTLKFRLKTATFVYFGSFSTAHADSGKSHINALYIPKKETNEGILVQHFKAIAQETNLENIFSRTLNFAPDGLNSLALI